jgi:transcriptional regulator with XRE-family HTH domain
MDFKAAPTHLPSVGRKKPSGRQFARYLDLLLAQRDMNQNSLAHASKTPQAYVSNAMTGKGSFPREEILDRWAKALALNADEARRFKFLAGLAQCPETVEQSYLELKRQLGDYSLELPEEQPPST